MLGQINRELSSPCNGFCNIDTKTDLCKGCFRKMSEITAWQSYSDAEKIEVLQKVKQRKEKLKHN